MASTYSTNLKLELIGTGDQSGTWGATTNTNMGTLIEQAIAGYATQAVTDSGVATVLTIPDGASSTGRNYVIALTGALTAARTVEVPAVNKPYIFFNSTTGGFAVTVKVTGQTGVVIANGKKAIVYTNTTDVIEVANAPATEAGTQTLTNKTLTAPVIATVVNTGTLTLPTSTDTLVGRATTDTLTNKTLTSPLIGTVIGGTTAASSLTLQSTSGVGTTDSILFKVGNNGATTALTIDTSGNASLAANLTFSGTAKRITGDFTNSTIANRVLFQTSTANAATDVGAIPNGTGTLSQITAWESSSAANCALGALRITASTDVRLISSVTGTGTLLPMTFYTGGSEAMRIDTSRNVGIGRTPITNTSTSIFQVTTGILNGSNGGLFGNLYYDTVASSWKYAANGYGGYIKSSGSNTPLEFGYASANNAGGAGAAASVSVGMVMDTSGNVGIGTTSPDVNLSVFGSTAVAADVGGAISIGGFYDGSNKTSYGSIAGVNQYGTGNTGGQLLFKTRTNFGSLTERMRIDQGGNVGIGRSPTYKLDVVAGTSVGSNPVLAVAPLDGALGRDSTLLFGATYSNGWAGSDYAARYSGAISFGASGGGGSARDWSMRFLTGGDVVGDTPTERMRIDQNGNLLVGTTSVVQNGTLSVVGAVIAGSFTNSYSSAGGACLDVTRTSATGDMMYFHTSSAANLAGYITCPTSSTTSYVSVSDYRLKENVTLIATGLEKILALKPVTYDWINDKLQGEGFIAHEVQAVIPLAVVGEKDAVNKDGSIKPQGIDPAKIVVHLVAAIQELEARLAKLETVQ